jgi:K+-sensing histidine kinase KdpD
MLGLVVCTALAIVFSLLLRETSLRGFVPYGFLVVIVAVAKIWGRLAGVLGTAGAALAFSFLLYSPVGSWIVNDDIARANLGWMMLTGMMSSHFFGKSNTSQDMMRNSE